MFFQWNTTEDILQNVPAALFHTMKVNGGLGLYIYIIYYNFQFVSNAMASKIKRGILLHMSHGLLL